MLGLEENSKELPIEIEKCSVFYKVEQRQSFRFRAQLIRGALCMLQGDSVCCNGSLSESTALVEVFRRKTAIPGLYEALLVQVICRQIQINAT